MKSYHYTVILVGLILSLTSVKGEKFDFGERFNQVKDEFQTPAIRWAKPYSKGRIKALFISGRHCMREVVELSQRMEVDYETVMSEGRTQWYLPLAKGLDDPVVNLDRFRNKLKRDFDVILLNLNSTSWDSIPGDIRFTILEKVAAGTGLVLAGKEWPESLANLPFEWRRNPTLEVGTSVSTIPPAKSVELPRKRVEAQVWSAELEKGRVVRMRLPDSKPLLITSGAPNYPAYEQFMQWGIRCLLYAAKKTPEPAWNELRINEGEKTVKVCGELTKEVDFVCRVVNEWDQEFFSTTFRGRKVDMTLPELPRGNYYLFVHANTDDGERLNWAALSFKQSRSLFIKAITAKERLRYVGDTCGFELLLSRKLPAECRIVAKVYDNNGRLLKERVVTPTTEAKRCPIELVVPETVSVVNYLEIDLVENERVLDRQRKTIGVQQPVDTEDFHLGVWGRKGGGFYPEAYLQRYFWEQGVDCGLFNLLPDGNIRVIDYLGCAPRVVWKKPKQTPPSVLDPDYRKQCVERMTARLRSTGEFSPFCASLGDEISYRYFDSSPLTRKVFIEYLKKNYKKLSKLNDAWGTNYSNWRNLISEDQEKLNKMALGNPYVKFAMQSFSERHFTDFFIWQQREVDKIQPGLRVGPEGIWSSPRSYRIDFKRLLEQCGFLASYCDKDNLVAVEAFSKPGALRGAWFGGYYVYPEFNEAIPWCLLMSGLNMPLWFAGGNPRSVAFPCPMFNGDWTLSTQTQKPFETVRNIKSGLGKLILSAEKQYDPIYVLYPNRHASTEFVKWISYLEALGFAPRLISEEQLRPELLSKAKLLILSDAPFLSESVKAIEEFVKNGGNLVADYSCGTRNALGGFVDSGCLDDIFGIKRRSTSPVVSEGDVQIDWMKTKVVLTPGLFGNVEKIGDGATAAGRIGDKDTPFVICSEYGKGKTVYLNFSLDMSREQYVKYSMLFHALFQWLNLKPIGNFLFDGPCVPCMRTARFSIGDVSVYMAHRHPEKFIYQYVDIWRESVPLKLKFERKYHLYDLRAGVKLGHEDNWTGSLNYPEPIIIAAAPYEISGFEPVEKALSAKAGENVAFKVKTPRFSDESSEYAGVARIEFFTPDQRSALYLNRNLHFSSRKTLSWNWRTALNEQNGLWSVKITDVLTQKHVTIPVFIEKEKN